MTSTRHLILVLAATAAVALAANVPARAQIVYPFPGGYRPGYPDASVRLDVTPNDAEVYIDGYYAGVVDDFDGVFQRLRVEPGQHEVTLYRDGYRPFHQQAYLARDRTFTIKQAMQKLPAGESAEARPTPAPVPQGAQPPLQQQPRNRRRAPANQPSPNTPPAGAAAPGEQPASGRLTIQLQPADASVTIDGQPWPASPGQDSVMLDLPEGRHVVQVRKPGYVGYLTEVEVRRGETTTVNVSLRTQS